MKNRITAQRLSIALDVNNIKAQELADRSGVNKASISQYMNGSHAPSNISAGKMAAVLGVDPVWLMGFDVPMLPSKGEKPRDLRSDESALLANYNSLNETGKEKAREAVEMLTTNILFVSDAPALLAAHTRTDIAPDPEGEAADVAKVIQIAKSKKSDSKND